LVSSSVRYSYGKLLHVAVTEHGYRYLLGGDHNSFEADWTISKTFCSAKPVGKISCKGRHWKKRIERVLFTFQVLFLMLKMLAQILVHQKNYRNLMVRKPIHASENCSVPSLQSFNLRRQFDFLLSATAT